MSDTKSTAYLSLSLSSDVSNLSKNAETLFMSTSYNVCANIISSTYTTLTQQAISITLILFSDLLCDLPHYFSEKKADR